jgi:dienelactone hydrolase
VHYQPHGISFAKNGYVCLILDPIQLAEIFALHHGVSFLSQYEWYARGYTPAGPEVWNAMRAIDYLSTRPEVDAARIGMTGRSGGAAMTWFTAAVDERVKVAAPVMGISTYRANLPLNTQRLHCDCMFAINSARHDMVHQGALIAPRPLLMAHGVKDELFPVAGYQEFERHVGALYESYGVRESFTNVEVDSGHQDSELLRGRVIEWMDSHLWRRPARKLDLSFEKEDGANLAVFDGAPPKDAVNFRLQDEFTRRPAKPMGWPARAKRLREIVGSIRIDAAANPETAVARAKAADAPRLLYVASPGEDAASLAWLFRAFTANTTQVTRMVVYPRGLAGVPWSAAVTRDMERNAMHVGWSVDSMRLSDVLAALRSIKTMGGGNVSVMGRGVAAGLALYAAILDPDVHQAVLMEPPASHAQGPFFLNILRDTDLPEVAALLAPRRLSFVASTLPEPYSLTKRLFTQLGVTDHLYAGVNLDGIVTGRYGHGYGSGY